MSHDLRVTVPSFPVGKQASRLSSILADEHDYAMSMQGRLPREQKEQFWSALGHVHERPYVGGIGVARCRLSRIYGTWELADDGIPAIIFPARDRPLFFGGSLIDLIAYQPSSRLCFRRTGLADVLGEWHLDFPTIEGEPLRVFSNPCAWAKSNGAGIVLLDWSNAYRILGHVDKLLVPNEKFGKYLRRQLTPPKPHVPDIFVPDGAR